jgi:hypothetical protein
MILVAGLNGLQCKNHYGIQTCRIEDESVLANTRSAPLDTAVTPDGNGGSIVAWAADGETYVVRLKKDEHPFIKPKMIEIPWGGGLEDSSHEKTPRPNSYQPQIQSEDLGLLSLSNKKSLLAVLKTPESGDTGGAFVTLISNDDLSSQTVRLGVVSEYAKKISALAWDDRVLVVWDGGVNTLKIQAALIRTSPFIVEKTMELAALGEGPALAMGKDGPFIAWSETLNKNDETIFNVMLAMISKDLQLVEQRSVAISQFVFTSPELVSTPSGLGLVYRDKEDKNDLAGLYFLPLSQDGAVLGEKQRISRSDGKMGPALKFVDGLFVTAAVRSEDHNLLIGINRFERTAEKKGGEFQVYADITDYVCVDIAASYHSIIMVLGEDKKEGGRVLAGRVVCADRT